MTAKENAQVADEAVRAAAVAVIAERLEQATALLRSLEQCVCWSDTYQAYVLYQRVRDVLEPARAFLSGAPAPVAEPDEETLRGFQTIVEWQARLEAAEATLAAVRAALDVDNDIGPEETLVRVERALSASPAPQHPDSVLLDRIAEKLETAISAANGRWSEWGDRALDVAEHLDEARELLRTRAQGQGGGNG